MYQRTRDLREDRDMNQTEIAGYPGMSRTGYSKYEIEENNIITSVLIKLSDFYNVSVDYLSGRTNKQQEMNK